MSDTLASLRRKIDGAGDLQSVVRSMKALAAASIGQYERSVRALGDYYHTVELSLAACLRKRGPHPGEPEKRLAAKSVNAIVFGSDQGLVGQFNDLLADYVVRTLKPLPGTKRVWAVGERIAARLTDVGLAPRGLYPVPASVNGITAVVGQILVEGEKQGIDGDEGPVWIFHNRPIGGASYEPSSQRLLPLDAAWEWRLARLPWPTRSLPEVVGDPLPALLREYIFVSLYRASAESLASENASRLAAMQRAETNIEDLLGGMKATFRHMRQTAIDEELFDVVSGFESLNHTKGNER